MTTLPPIVLQPGDSITISAAPAVVPPPPPPPPPPPDPIPVPTPILNSVPVPVSINSGGSADASAALNALIASVADGKTLVFKQGGLYRIDSSLLLAKRKNLGFDLNGATLKAAGTGSGALSSPFRLNPGNDRIAIFNGAILGNNPNVTTLYTVGQEDQFGVLIYGSTNIDLHHLAISHTWGDAVYVGPDLAAMVSSDGISIHDNTFSFIGRMGIAVVAGSHVTVEHNSIDRVGIHVFDIEPDVAWEVNTFVAFRGNTIGSYGHSNTYIGFLLAANGATGSVAHDIECSGNTVVGNPKAGYDGKPRALHCYVMTARRGNVRFVGNTTAQAAPGPVLAFAHVDGLTISGNVQPLTSGSLATISDSTAVVQG